MVDLECWLRLADQGRILKKLKLPLTYKRLHDGQNFENEHNFLYRVKGFKVILPYLFKGKKVHLIIIKILTTLYGIVPKTIRNIISKYKSI